MKLGQLISAAAAAVMAVSMTGCGLAYKVLNTLDPPDPDDPNDRYRLYKVVPDNWYEETLKYYNEGYSGDFANERSDLPFSDEMKDKNNKFGYLLRDLDGDGDDELLIGFADDEKETRFTELYIWHTDFGAMRMFSCGGGSYMYLCEDNLIRDDSLVEYEGKPRYMKFNGENNSMTILNDVTGTPQKVELTPFGS